ncbi:DUF1552 domain-containing protein [Cellvibrio japonicus]|uniref:Conserved domain protein n=1 Tax=Cellvibrio japonicus (strain Ueda107) TaxID=498211 RepID=B3PLJ7_CELJU|nr:DUF1552 domain-containing protein [Cellvibrio japonicus]ACE84196.1 conserved domain protein [Cellvibrio japonicus Ueda107]QEI12983.1 DUF1552 domain-containing protein [Cellvibrio japonicus]QEI16557.1 DUF1552 domain-containing protein [Cellvibrio japonicus]QEI20135.1 DUF1552 domain-containing protein [Cellvibrio japonicus]
MRYKDCFDKERRDFLKVVKHAGISAGLIKASSLLAGVMLARTAEAQSGTPTKHCLVFSGGGCHPDKWFPSGSTLPVQSAQLQSHYSRIALLRNASLSGAGHGVMFHRFNNGSWSEDSFDVNLGRTIGANYPVRYLNVGTTAESALSREGFNGKPIITSPQAALDILFSGGSGGGSSSGSTTPRKSVVDLHYTAISSLRTKLGQHEKDKLDSHFTAIREIEDALDTGTNPGGSCPQPPSTAVTGFDALSKLHTDIVALALECNLTASVSIAFGTDAHTHFLDVLGRESHQSHHNQGNMPLAYTEDIAYMQGLTKNLFDKFNAKGLLSSTIVTQVSDMGDADSHGNSNVPMLVAGAGITGGRVIDIGGRTQSELYQTLGLKLRADQSPNGAAYRSWATSTISGL